ncbi:Metallo-dependent phosphatase-like protein [Paraphysoderma sedebokerense]|nr:Metallo-dependent phosphatase-like protein [Paraphysoderma sedebokerense]
MSLFIRICLIFYICRYSVATLSEWSSTDGAQSLDEAKRPLIPGPLRNDDQPFRMTIMHTNDFHSHFSEFRPNGGDCTVADKQRNECFGGLARMKTVINEIRGSPDKYPHTYLLDAGDQFSGTPFFSVFKGQKSVEYMNAFGYDAMTLGNHEFDEGPETLSNFVSRLSFPAVSANIDASSDEYLSSLIQPYTILTKYGLRVGVVGITTLETIVVSKIGTNVKISDPVEALQNTVNFLRKRGITKIICLTHNGYAEDQEIARQTSGISLFIGGHTHTFLSNLPGVNAEGPYPTVVKNAEGKNTYIVQAKAWGEYLGLIQIEWDAVGSIVNVKGDPIHLNYEIEEDPEVLSEVNLWREGFDAASKIVIGYSEQQLDHKICLSRPCASGIFLNQAMLFHYYQKLNGANNPVVIFNSRGIRAGISQGEVTMGTIHKLLPFRNTVITVPVLGQYIKAIIENLVSSYNIYRNKPLLSTAQLLNIRYTVSRSTTASSSSSSSASFPASSDNGGSVSESSKRISSIQILTRENTWVELDLNETYDLVTLDFLALGGDNIFPTHIETLPKGEPVFDVVVEYLKSTQRIAVPDIMTKRRLRRLKY